MAGLSLRASLIALSALSLLVSVGLGAVSLRSLDAVNGGAHTLNDEIVPQIAQAGAMSIAFADLRISEAEHVSSANEAAKRAAEKGIADAKRVLGESMAEYRRALPADAAAQTAVADRIAAAVENYIRLDATFVEMSSTYREIDAGALFVADMKQAHSAIAAMLDELLVISGRAAEATDAANHETFEQSWWMVLALVVGGLVVSAASAAFGFLGVSRPMGRIRDVMARVAGGDLETPIPLTDRGHEIGAMAGAVQVFKDGLIHARALEAETEQARRRRGAAQGRDPRHGGPLRERDRRHRRHGVVGLDRFRRPPRP